MWDFLFIFKNFSDEVVIFTICVSVLFFFFSIFFLKSIFKSEYGYDSRKAYLILLITILAFEELVFKSEYRTLTCLTLFIGGILSFLIFSIRVRKKIDIKSEKHKQSELAKFIEKSVREMGEESQVVDLGEEVEPIKRTKTDFTHVKKVIRRLNEKELASSERIKVNELENLILAVGDGEANPDFKRKLNDGLGALLKLMAKYHL